MDHFPTVRQVVHVEEIDSTNDLARRLIEAGTLLQFPSLIWADRQTRGRGQRSNTWWSDSGSLTFTLVLDPVAHGLSVEQESRVALASAVVIVEAIHRHVVGCYPGIRWPNDVEVAGRKLGGILPERVDSTDGPRLLVGIGLNVQTRLGEAPEPVARMAASLAEWSTDVTKLEILREILDGFPTILARLAADDRGLAGRWARWDSLVGTPIQVEVGGELIDGVALGIDARGGLILGRGGSKEILHAGRVLRPLI